MASKDTLKTRKGRLLTFSLLYLSEGIPFGFTAIALTTYLRMQGVGLAEIGAFTASLYAPWAFKWMWAPLVDMIQSRRFGPKRAWIFTAQLLMMLTLGTVLFLDIGHNLRLLTMLIIVHNVFAATQDVAIDALAVRILPKNERGVANGFMFGASYLGQTIGGSGALYIAGSYGFNAAFPFVLMALGLILVGVTLRIKEPPVEEEGITSPGESLFFQITSRLRTFFIDLYQGFFKSGIGPLVGVLFSLLPFGALALGLALGATMQVDLGMTEKQIANLTIITTIIAALGCILGGWISDRIGHRKALAIWYILTTLPTFYLASKFTGTEGMEGITLQIFYIAVCTYSFASGLLMGTSTAVFMGLTNPVIAATQFTGYMALHNLVYTYSSLWQGHFADIYGYAKILTLDGWLAFVPLLLLPFLRPSTRSRE
jgi:PAT family beta-lactamase induction signal transducer AmpG